MKALKKIIIPIPDLTPTSVIIIGIFGKNLKQPCLSDVNAHGMSIPG